MKLEGRDLPVVLFGYDSSPFTNKVRLVLRIKGVPFSYIPVPSTLPRPLLTTTFALTYRKIPVLLIGRHLYCDTPLINEALEHFFPVTAGFATIYPPFPALDTWTYKSLVRGFASFWTDKPLFRVTTGLIPQKVWESGFGKDRAQLIGHGLDAQKLGKKVQSNLAGLDAHLSMLEPGFSRDGWAVPTDTPSLADVSLYYQLRWGMDIAAGVGVENLSGGRVEEGGTDVVGEVFNGKRYPGLWRWFQNFEKYVQGLEDKQKTNPGEWLEEVRKSKNVAENEWLLPSAGEFHAEIQKELVPGVRVSIAPDDTGKDNPTVGTLVKIGIEEMVIKPDGKAEVDVLVHFPRLGFVVKVVDGARL